MIVRGRETTEAAHMMRETKGEGPRSWSTGSQERKTVQARRVQSTDVCLSLRLSSRLIPLFLVDCRAVRGHPVHELG